MTQTYKKTKLERAIRCKVAASPIQAGSGPTADLTKWSYVSSQVSSTSVNTNASTSGANGFSSALTGSIVINSPTSANGSCKTTSATKYE